VQAARKGAQVVDIRGAGAGHRCLTCLIFIAAAGCGTVTRAHDAAGRGRRAQFATGEPDAAACLPGHASGQLGKERTAEVVNGLFGSLSAGGSTRSPGGWHGSLHGFEEDLRTAMLDEAG